MKQKVNAVIVFLLFIIAGVCKSNVSLAQCATTSPPSYSNSCTSDYFTSITASGTGVVSTIGVTGSSCAGVYFDYYSSQGVVVVPGTTVNMSMARYATYNAYLSVYIDWNNNGIYEATELAGSTFYMPISILSTVYSFTIPSSGVVTGVNLHMRMMLSELASGAPCTANWGETCDFYINVGCSTPVITVTPSAPAICSGGSTTLTASGAGAGGTYTWTPSTGLSATTGATVTASPAAPTTYTVTGTTTTGCSADATVTVSVNPMPGSITGASAVCPGSAITLSDAVTGGTWSNDNTGIATIDAASGILSGVSAGATVVTYTLGGGCDVTMTVTVNPGPSPISGASTVCVGSSVMFSDSVPGGTWSSDNASVAFVSGTGMVSGVAGGTANISYAIGACYATTSVTVTTIAPVTGSSNVCAGTTISVSDATPGGVWSSANTIAATVSVTGIVTGVISGSAAIVYTVGACSVSLLVTVGSAVSAITGEDSVCTGSVIHVNDATPGGAWSSGAVSVATVFAGAVTGVTAGTAEISYSVGGCSATTTVTVIDTAVGIITGKDSVCIGSGHIIVLSDNVAGGTWSSANTRATVDPLTGIVTGVASGVDTIKYTIVNFCGTFVTKHVIHVRTPAQCATALSQVIEERAGLKLFPNPNSGAFTLNLISDFKEEAHVIITDLTGKKIMGMMTVTNQDTDIKFKASAGLYLVFVHTEHGNYNTKVVVR